MLKLTGHSVLIGLIASALLNAAPVIAADDTPGYVLDKDGNPVLAGAGDCVNAPQQPKSHLFEECGDGSADSDGDGVPNDQDKCPNTPKGVTVDKDGCPVDSDGDGVPDYLDECPGTPKGVSVDSKGCPLDSDGDGVPDYLDKCPGTPAGVKVDADGCGIVVQDVRTTLDSKLVNFALDKANLTPAGKSVIDNVIAYIKKEGAYVKVVDVIGHTDSTGSSAYNQKLSERRAKAVADYLISGGISASQVNVIGKGESEPVASNKTSEGRASNRRAEISVKLMH